MKIVPIDRSKGEKEVYPSPGCCIYCGRNDLPLEDEHIVPFGIAGDGVIFDDASCRPCASAINRDFETHVLRSMFLPVRIRADAPTRSKGERPKTLELKVVPCDGAGRAIGPVASTLVEADEFPLSLMGWSFPRPGIIAGRAPSDEVLGSPWVSLLEHEYAPYIEAYRRQTGHQGPVAVSVGRMEEQKFFRFLAKTAHAFAVAGEGPGAFEPLTLDVIFGRSKLYCHYIGSGDGHDDEPVGVDETFRLAVGSIIKRGVEYVAVLVQPFSLLGSPKYIVIVGKRERARNKVPLSGEP